MPCVHQNLTDSERTRLASELAEHYQRGHSLTRLAADLGHSYGFVRRLLLDLGVQLRPRGGHHRAPVGGA